MADSNAGGDDLTLYLRRLQPQTRLAHGGAGIVLFQDGLPVSAADGNNHNRMLDPNIAHRRRGRQRRERTDVARQRASRAVRSTSFPAPRSTATRVWC